MGWIRRTTVAVGLMTATVALASGVALANKGKPGGGGGGGSSGPAGTLFYVKGWSGGDVIAMDTATGSKTTLQPSTTNLGTHASRRLHGGKRWFLQREKVDGEETPGGQPSRWDLFAVREDGTGRVRLTSDPNMDYSRFAHMFDWAPDEDDSGATIAGFARSWTGTTKDDTVVVESCGLYTARIDFDSNGDVVGLESEPSLLLTVGTVFNGTGKEAADATSFSWSPDMSEVVVDGNSPTNLRVFTVSNGTSTTILSIPTDGWGNAVCWSPDGARIAYHRSASNGSWTIETITPTGGGRTTVVSEITKKNQQAFPHSPLWSPDSAHIAYIHQPKDLGKTVEIRRVTASGSGSVTLDTSSATPVVLLDWR
jgi:hypothetical protein